MQLKSRSNTTGCAVLAICFAILCGACTSSEDVQPPAAPDFPYGGSLNLDQDALPEGWTHSNLSVNHSSSGDSVDVEVRGEGTTLLAAIDGIRDRLSIAVTIDPDVDENARLEILEIDVKAGSWDDLPKKIADAYGYAVSTKDGETRIVRSNE